MSLSEITGYECEYECVVVSAYEYATYLNASDALDR